MGGSGGSGGVRRQRGGQLSTQNLGTRYKERFSSHATSLPSPRVPASTCPAVPSRPAWKMLPCLSFPTGGNLDWEQSAGKALPMGSGGEAANISLMLATGPWGQGHPRGLAPAWDMSPMSPEVQRLGHAVSDHTAAPATGNQGAEKPRQIGEPSLLVPSPTVTASPCRQQQAAVGAAAPRTVSLPICSSIVSEQHRIYCRQHCRARTGTQWQRTCFSSNPAARGAAKSHREQTQSWIQSRPPEPGGGQGCTLRSWGGEGSKLVSQLGGNRGQLGSQQGICTDFWQRELSPCLWAWGITCSPAICSCPGFDRVAGKQIRSQHTFEGLLFIHKTNPNTYKKKWGKNPDPGLCTIYY